MTEPYNPFDVTAEIDQLMNEYESHLHAIQSGIAMEMNYDRGPTSPKHLRVGVNSAMVSHSAAVKLLVEKGIISYQEYWEALVEAAQEERIRVEELVRQYLSPASPDLKIHLA